MRIIDQIIARVNEAARDQAEADRWFAESLEADRKLKAMQAHRHGRIVASLILAREFRVDPFKVVLWDDDMLAAVMAGAAALDCDAAGQWLRLNGKRVPAVYRMPGYA